jgi:glycine/D-amino acid oxidase-like deaminating enzyme
MRETADVVVIGGGVTGCSIAWHLTRGGARVRLVERSDIGAGSSGASPGIVRQYYADRALCRLAADGLDVYRHWREIVGGECGYRRTSFFTAVPIADEHAVRAHVASLQAMGIALECMSAETLRHRYPDLSTDDLAGAVYEPDAGYCDARTAALTWARSARSSGAAIELGRTVQRIRSHAGRVTGVETDRGPIDCETVINAAGPWAAMLAAECGAPLPISASRQSVAIMRIAQEQGNHLPGYSDRHAGFYLRPDAPGYYLIGSLRPEDSGPTNPNNVGLSMTYAQALVYRDRAARRFARLANAMPSGSRVSFFDDTPDGNPLFGPDPRVQGIFVAAGLSGHGFKFAPVFGQAAAQWLSSGRIRPEMRAFEIARVLT